jgi:hypothetical protein
MDIFSHGHRRHSIGSKPKFFIVYSSLSAQGFFRNLMKRGQKIIVKVGGKKIFPLSEKRLDLLARINNKLPDFFYVGVMYTQVNMMLVMLLRVYIHTGQA